MTKRILFFVYGLASYAFFLVTFLYLVGFLANTPFLPKTIDSGEPASLGFGLVINTALMLAFGLHHSIFARPTFKRWFTRYVPQPIERATYVLVATLFLAAVMAWWQPLPQIVWNFQHPIARGFVWAMFGLGFALILYATFLIDHFELFGLRQVVQSLLNKQVANEKFVVPLLYRLIRHPLMLGWLIAFWATPTMTAGHLLFALVNSGYIFIGIAHRGADAVSGPRRAVSSVEKADADVAAGNEMAHQRHDRVRPAVPAPSSDEALRHQHEHVFQRRVLLRKAAQMHPLRDELVQEFGDAVVVGRQFDRRAVVFHLHVAAVRAAADDRQADVHVAR